MNYPLFSWTRGSKPSRSITTDRDIELISYAAPTAPSPTSSEYLSHLPHLSHLSPEDLALRQMHAFHKPPNRGALTHGPHFWPGGVRPEVPGERVPFVIVTHMERAEAAATRLAFVINEFVGVHAHHSDYSPHPRTSLRQNYHSASTSQRIYHPFATAAQMHAFRTEVLKICRAYDEHISAGSPLDERDARAVQVLRVFQNKVMPDLARGRLVMQRDGALWERDPEMPGCWVDVSRRVGWRGGGGGKYERRNMRGSILGSATRKGLLDSFEEGAVPVLSEVNIYALGVD